MPESDYIDRTIATVRLHVDEKDNCWPQWANIFADEIEDLRARLAAIEAELVLTYAEFSYVYECARLRLKPRWYELETDAKEEWLADARVQVDALLAVPSA